MHVVVHYTSHDPEMVLAQNAGNGSPVAASDYAFAALEAASFVVLEDASFVAWVDVTRGASQTVTAANSAAVQIEQPERTVVAAAAV